MMSQSSVLAEVKVESIFHPSDFSAASEIAFVHALKIALVAKARLTVLHSTARVRVPNGRTSPAFAKHLSGGNSSRKAVPGGQSGSSASKSRKLSRRTGIP